MTPEIEHGITAYTRGCRCGVCRNAKSAADRSYNAQRLATADTDPTFPHGKGTGYKYGCRCTDCRAAYTKLRSERYRREPRQRRIREPLSAFVERFWSRVEKTDTCWLWVGPLSKKDGYGVFQAPAGPDGLLRLHLTHRFSYETQVGPIPAGLQLDHLCRNRACVNPAHLEPVTQAVNILRGTSPSARNARKTRCIRGHDFDSENTYVKPNGDRQCRKCARLMDGAWKKRRKATAALSR